MLLKCALLIAALGCLNTSYGNPSKSTGTPWYSNAIVYELYPRSFQDSNGDGVGDLNGIIQRADYLAQLGIDAIWLNPIYKSPDKDFGYDINNFEDIQPLFGTLDDFKKLVEVLDGKGIGVIMDFVPNHSSDEHPWFVKSANGEKDYLDYYVWHEGKIDQNGNRQPPNNWVSLFGGSMWTFNDKRQKYYLHQFLPQQPDLNFRNPKVVQEMQNVLKFWMDMGVRGFRIDAVSSLVESDTFEDEPFFGRDPNNYGEYIHTMTLEQPGTFDVLQGFMEFLESYTKENNRTSAPKLVMTENYNYNYDVIQKYYGSKDKPRSTFPLNMFWITVMGVGSNASQWAYIINEWNNQAMPSGGWSIANWVLGNHDQLRMSGRFSPEHVDLLNMLQLSLKGVAIVYYGDELGLENNQVRRDQALDPQGLRADPKDFSWRDRDFCRGPMPWNNKSNADFTKGTPWLPLASDYWKNNVESQSANLRSHLSLFRKMAKLRRTDVMKTGDSEVTSDGQVLLVYRSSPQKPTIVTVLNLGFFQETVDLKNTRPSISGAMTIYAASGNFPLTEESE
ncbi:alpha-glucosidase [Nesidiocoris tenuis]|uniref:alpha-glucosidase n=1 Tax=Nesidiocoris tenuis TaxID=355587 RepID=A0ABN7AUR8_9HEMI|nr:alpha-glucosidase [Nesidiocoris tenuis]